MGVNPSKKYSYGQVILHWISAVIIIWGTISGFYVALVTVPIEVKNLIGFINVSLTTLFIPVFIIRLYIYIISKKSLSISSITTMQRIAHLVHLIIYINISIVLISGVLMMERDINVFGVFFIPQPINTGFVTKEGANKFQI